MKLLFRKVTDTTYNLKYGWMLVIQDIETLIYYQTLNYKPQLPRVWDNVISTINGQSHINSTLGTLLKLEMEVHKGEAKSIIEHTDTLLKRLYKDKMKVISETGGIYINKNGGYFCFHKGLQIQDEKILKNKAGQIVFPKYTEKDIKIIQWENGKHYYAKIGNIDVVDKMNNQKWNTKKRAQEIANEFLENQSK